MGYDVHITRMDFWPDSEEDPITAEEWRAYVDAAEDMRWDHDTVFGDMPLAVWTAHPTRRGEDAPWLSWSEGQIDTKYPDDPTLRKMHEIAQHFGAQVRGDEDEQYGADGRVIPDENYDEEGRPRHRQGRRVGLLGRLFGRG